MSNKKAANVSANNTTQKEEKDASSEDLFKRIQENNPTMTLDEIGDFFLNKYLYKRKFRFPK